MASSKEIKEEYTSSLADLTFNSKPLISVLTMLAEENIQHAKDIVEAIEEHLARVRTDVKLPILYLIDCIIKNVGGAYLTLFSQNIVRTFCGVFETVDEKTRAEMFKLRQTWNDVLPLSKLYALDVQINMLDPAWPVTAAPPSNSIHLNPKFLKTNQTAAAIKKDIKSTGVVDPTLAAPIIPVTNAGPMDPATLDMQKKLISKQRELLELQQKKLELELLQTQVKLQEQMKTSGNVAVSKTAATLAQNLLLKPEVAKQLAGTTVGKANTTFSTTGRPRPTAAAVPSPMAQKFQMNPSPRIAPVNSALVNTVRPTRDPRLLRQQQQLKQPVVNSNVSLESKQNIDSNNKFVNNSKMGVRGEPRLPINKSIVPSPDKQNSFLKSSRKEPTRKILVKSSPRKNSDRDSVKSSSSSSSLDSPVKKVGEKKSPTSPTKSPSRHKKKDGEKKSPKSPKGELSPQFRDLKATMKARNYIRRSRKEDSPSEAVQDVDLRLKGPPEKQPRLQGEADVEKGPKIDLPSQGMDIDLRQLSATAVKRRSSPVDEESPTSKKSKSEMFDVLFGNEDTDLRQLPVPMASPPQIDRPPTPPPPIISSNDLLENKSKKSPPESAKTSPKKTKLDILRAKLASTIRNKDENAKKDVDLRLTPLSSPDKLNKIIISPADEQCIKAGNMTKAQEKALMNKIIAQIETQKLREAQRKESESLGNISLQPISDDELEMTFSDDEQEKAPKPEDKDERVPPLHHSQPDDFPKFQQRPMDIRRPPMNWRGRRRGFDGPPMRRGMPDPWMRGNGPWRPMGPPPNLRQPNSYIPKDDDVMEIDDNHHENSQDLVVDCDSNQDNHKTINIDDVPRDIRYYDDVAIMFLNWDDPREISFQNGSRRVIFNEKDIFTLAFNEPYRDVCINGDFHKIKLGAPTRELYVDDKYYECYFGGPSFKVDLNGKMVDVRLEGPPPQVKIGITKRTDLVCGKINMIIDAKRIVPVFLDATLQKFNIEGKTHTLKFADALMTALIDDVPFQIEFGGLPKPFMLHDRKHFIRFSVLPKGVRQGHVKIKDMTGDGKVSPAHENENSQDGMGGIDLNLDSNEPALPVPGRKRITGGESPENNSNSPHFFQNVMQQQNLNNLDVLSSVISSAMAPSTNEGGYHVENAPTIPVSQPVNLPVSKPQPVLPSAININELFQKLVATGIVTTSASTEIPPAVETPAPKPPPPTPKYVPTPTKKEGLAAVRPVLFAKPETLKIRQPAVFHMLYTGMQCSSCGMRFPPEQSMLYSQHLDWHFRQNRRGKKNVRKAASRKWYYSLSDWKNYEEIEDLEEREKSYFDQQQAQLEGANDEQDEEIEIPTVPADPNVQNAHCEICQDKFEQFYNEEKEEWQLRMAIRVNDKTYHPLCYEDYQTSLNIPIDVSVADEEAKRELEKIEEDKRIPGLEIVLDDDEEEEEEELKEEVQEAVASEEKAEELEEKKENEEVKMEEDEDDDDVILNEVVPEKIVVDDDDDDEQMEFPTSIKIKEEPIDDGFMDVTGGVLKVKGDGEVKIKAEPKENDDPETPMEEVAAPPITSEPVETDIETAHLDLVSSIDGNIDLETGTPVSTSSIGGKIKINISKPILPLVQPKETKEPIIESEICAETFIDPSQPLPPGEEPVQLNMKPALKGVELKKLPVVKKGTELTGLCSIM